MTRTRLLLGLAALLGLLAVGLGRPQRPSFVVPSSAPPSVAAASDPGTVRLQARLSHPVVPVGPSELFVTVDLEGTAVSGAQRVPVNLALVIDRSGSMSGEKLTQAKRAAEQLVSQLTSSDRLSIVHYGSDVKALPGLFATEAHRAQMRRFIARIEEDGGTHIEAGLRAAREQLLAAKGQFAVNRLLLLSDGQPTEGLTDTAGLTSLARALRTEGLTVSAFGVGVDFNEDLMQGLAESGAGSYGFLDDPARLASLFERDLQQAATTVAREVTLTFELPEGVSRAEVLGYQAINDGRALRVGLSDLAAGQRERVVARLFVDAPAPKGELPIATVRVRYSDVERRIAGEARAAVSARVSESLAEVAAARDGEASVAATRAMAAANLTGAAELLRKGDRAAAKARLEQNALLYQQTAALPSAPSMEAESAQNDAMIGAFGSASSGAAVERSVKEAKVQARKGFGRLGSTY